MARKTLTRAAHGLGLLLIVAAIVVTVAVAFPQAAGADRSYVVLSGSMSPTIQTGDVVFVSETAAEAVEEGDVLAFDRIPGDGKRTVHRVVEVIQREDSLYFRTKGDANEEPDPQLVPADAVIGTVSFWIPYVGRVFSFASTDLGTLSLVVVPGILLAVSELWNLVRAARTPNTDDGEGTSR